MRKIYKSTIESIEKGETKNTQPILLFFLLENDDVKYISYTGILHLLILFPFALVPFMIV